MGRIVTDINMTIVHKLIKNIELHVLVYERSAIAILVYIRGSRYITLPKIMILGIVMSNQKGLFYEPLFLSIPVMRTEMAPCGRRRTVSSADVAQPPSYLCVSVSVIITSFGCHLACRKRLRYSVCPG